jgi:hypothetical protein
LRAADDAEICDSIQLPHHTSKVAKGSPRTSILNFPERLVLASQPVDSSLSSTNEIFFFYGAENILLCVSATPKPINRYRFMRSAINHRASSVII